MRTIKFAIIILFKIGSADRAGIIFVWLSGVDKGDKIFKQVWHDNRSPPEFDSARITTGCATNLWSLLSSRRPILPEVFPAVTDWDRDLATDLDAIINWGADVDVTLLEEFELQMLGITITRSRVWNRF